MLAGPESAKACSARTELQKRVNRANELVLFFLAGAIFWEKHAKNSAFLVLIFLWEKLIGANFYAFCNYVPGILF